MIESLMWIAGAMAYAGMTTSVVWNAWKFGRDHHAATRAGRGVLLVFAVLAAPFVVAMLATNLLQKLMEERAR